MGAVDGLLLVLASTFSVILMGYVLRTRGVLTAQHAEGIGKLVGFIALPSLLFLSMATIEFSSVNWLFLLGFLISKYFIFALVFLFSFVIDRSAEAPLSVSSLRAMASTQSNDFALGLPVLNALFPPNIVQYLFLTAPIQLVLINPFGFILLEFGKRNSKNAESSKGLLVVVWNVVRNPVVFMTLFGMAFGFAVNHRPPQYFSSTLTTLGNAFSAGALLNLGGSLVGKLGDLRGKSLLLPMLLVLAKSVLLPVVILVVLSLLGVDRAKGSDGKEYDLTLLGFLIGTLPSAPSVYVYAIQAGISVSEMVRVVVLSTAASAPVTLLSSVLADISINDDGNWENILSNTSTNLAIVSLIGAGWVLFIHTLTRMQNQLTRLHIVVLSVCMIVLSVSIQFCRISADDSWDRVRYVFIRISLFSIRITFVMNTISMALWFRFGKSICERSQKGLQMASTCLVFAEVFCSIFAFDRPSGGFNGQLCWYPGLMGNHSTQTGFVVLAVTTGLLLLGLVCAMVILIRSYGKDTNSNLSQLSVPLVDVADRVSDDELSRGVSRETESHPAPDKVSVSEEPENFDNISFRDVLLVTIQACSLVSSFFVCVWLLVAADGSGVFIQIAFIDIFLISSTGFFLFLVHGTKRRYTEPVDQLFHRLSNYFSRGSQSGGRTSRRVSTVF